MCVVSVCVVMCILKKNRLHVCVRGRQGKGRGFYGKGKAQVDRSSPLSPLSLARGPRRKKRHLVD